MDNSYLWLKLIHIVGVVLFLGNIIVTGWWKTTADLTRNPHIIAFAQRQVTLTDYIFTFGGVLMLLSAGMANVGIHQISLNTYWVKNAFNLFTISGLIWLFILIPVQYKQAKMAQLFAVTGDIPAQYWTLCNLWYLFGAIATVLPMINLYWMVFKPYAA